MIEEYFKDLILSDPQRVLLFLQKGGFNGSTSICRCGSRHMHFNKCVILKFRFDFFSGPTNELLQLSNYDNYNASSAYCSCGNPYPLTQGTLIGFIRDHIDDEWVPMYLKSQVASDLLTGKLTEQIK